MSIYFNTSVNNKKISNCIKELDYYGYTKIDNILNNKQINHFLSLVNKNTKINKIKKFNIKVFLKEINMTKFL